MCPVLSRCTPSVPECPEQQGFKHLCGQPVPCQALSQRNGRRSLSWSRLVPVTAAPSVPSDGQAKRRYFLIQQRGLRALWAMTSTHTEKHFKGVSELRPHHSPWGKGPAPHARTGEVAGSWTPSWLPLASLSTGQCPGPIAPSLTHRMTQNWQSGKELTLKDSGTMQRLVQDAPRTRRSRRQRAGGCSTFMPGNPGLMPSNRRVPAPRDV